MADQTSFQFQCPSCGAVLQAGLRTSLTSVQCGECYDVFDVQLPGRCTRAPGPQTGGNPFQTPRLEACTLRPCARPPLANHSSPASGAF